MVEITITFALLAIFLSCAAVIIGSIANMYYQIKGENHSRQVADILMDKVAAGLEGAQYKEKGPMNPSFSNDFRMVTLNDRTDTRLTFRAQDGELILVYDAFKDKVNGIEKHATTWKFDEAVYDGFSLEKMYFVPGDKVKKFYSDQLSEKERSNYSFPASEVNYKSDIVVIFQQLHNAKYGDYYNTRVVKMYNVSEEPAENTGTGGNP